MADKPKDGGTDNKKQKIMIAVIVVIVLVILWQVLGGSGSGESTPAPVAKGKQGGVPAMGANKPDGSGAMMSSGGAQPQQAPSTDNTLRQAPVPINAELMKLQQQTQVDYIASVNKLEMLKIQRDIDETKTAIANAELSRMTAEKSIADLITSRENSGGGDMGPIGGQPNSPFGNPPPPDVKTGSPTGALPTSLPPVTRAAPPPVTYNVVSVTYQGHRWAAIIAPEGKSTSMSTVHVGDTLDDGSVVVAISRDGIMVKHDNKMRKIMIASTI
jgi:hypothetical protein